ncbi:MAG: hypothetical protein AAB401_17090, partial [Acidobacteriota bacterium]
IGRRLGLTWQDLKQFAVLGRLALTALIAAFVTVAAKLAMTALPVQFVLVIGSLVFGATYLVALFASGAVTAEEQSQLRALWQKFYRFGAVRIGRIGVSSATGAQ